MDFDTNLVTSLVLKFFWDLYLLIYTSFKTCFIFQLVPAVTELVVAELMYLQWMDPKEPIYIYINSTGTTRDDGETVSVEFISKYEE